MTDIQKKFVKLLKTSALVILSIILGIFVLSAFKIFAQPDSSTTGITANSEFDAKIVSWGFISASIVVGLGSIAAGIAVAYVGSAALGSLGEKPEIFGRALIFVALAEGIAIYGLIIGMMILAKLG